MKFLPSSAPTSSATSRLPFHASHSLPGNITGLFSLSSTYHLPGSARPLPWLLSHKRESPLPPAQTSELQPPMSDCWMSPSGACSYLSCHTVSTSLSPQTSCLPNTGEWRHRPLLLLLLLATKAWGLCCLNTLRIFPSSPSSQLLS